MTIDEERLLLAPGHERHHHHDHSSSKIIDFDPNGDPDNPLEWSKAYKLGIVTLLSFMAFTVTFTCIGIVPIADHIISDLTPPTTTALTKPPSSPSANRTPTILLVTIWELGEALGPLLIGPLSESYGRLPTLLLTNTLFTLSILLSLLSPTIPLLITSRFLTGFFVASNVLNPAIIGDIFTSDERGQGMSLIMLAPLIGGAVGPAIGGAVAENWGWRIVLWGAFGGSCVCEVVVALFLRETYKVSILKERAKRLRVERGDPDLKCVFEVEEAARVEGCGKGKGKGKGAGDLVMESWSSRAGRAIMRPVLVMWDSRVLKVMALFGGYIFTFYYVIATSLPGILKETYGFSPTAIGASFLCFSIGATFGLITCNLLSDRIYIYLNHRTSPSPSNRLPILLIGSFLMPLSIAFYGLAPALFPNTPIPFLISVGASGYLMLVIWISTASYIVEAFGLYSASAMTIILIVRNTGGTVFPLLVPTLQNGLGLGGAFVVLGGGCAVCALGPVAVWVWGEEWRKGERFGEEEDMDGGVERNGEI